VIATGAIIAALIVIGTALLKLYNIAKRIDAAIGVDENGRTISQRLGAVEDAVMPTGRATLPARVDQIEKEVKAIDTDMKQLSTEVRTIHDFVVKNKEK